MVFLDQKWEDVIDSNINLKGKYEHIIFSIESCSKWQLAQGEKKAWISYEDSYIVDNCLTNNNLVCDSALGQNKATDKK